MVKFNAYYTFSQSNNSDNEKKNKKPQISFSPSKQPTTSSPFNNKSYSVSGKPVRIKND